MRRLAALLLCGAMACSPEAPAPPPVSGWAARAAVINGELRGAVDQALIEGEGAAAIKAIDDCYYGRFEQVDANMEIAIRGYVSRRRAAEIEEAFALLKKAIRRGSPALIVEERARKLTAMIEEDAGRLDALARGGG